MDASLRQWNPIYIKNSDRSVSKVTEYELEDRSSISGRQEVFLCRDIQEQPRDHPISHPSGKRDTEARG